MEKVWKEALEKYGPDPSIALIIYLEELLKLSLTRDYGKAVNDWNKMVLELIQCWRDTN